MPDVLPPPPITPSSDKATGRDWTRLWLLSVVAVLPLLSLSLFILSGAYLDPRTVTESAWILLGPFAALAVPSATFAGLAVMCWPRRRYKLYIGTVLAVTLGQIALLLLDQRLMYDHVQSQWTWARIEGRPWPDSADLSFLAVNLLPNLVFLAIAVIGLLKSRLAPPGSPRWS